MIPFFLGMGQQEIAIIFIVFLFFMVVSPVIVTLLARLTRPFRNDDPEEKKERSSQK